MEERLAALSREKTYYYEHLPAQGNRKRARRRGITNEKDTIMMLVRKRYLEQAAVNLSADIKKANKKEGVP